jgi:O-methyltransferase domain/Dimerisation domain
MVTGRLRLWPLLKMLRRTGRNSWWAEVRPLLRDRLLEIRGIPKKQANPGPPALLQMAAGYWLSQAIYVTAKLGIADLLVQGPKSAAELAATTGVDAQSLFRVLRALVGAGIFSPAGTDSFALSRLGENLRTGVSGSLRAALITIGEIHYHAFGDLLQSVRTGSPAFNHVFGMGLFDYLRQNDGDASVFDAGMSDLAAMLSYAVLCVYDFSGIRHIMDIGGGQGAFLRNVLKIYPQLKCTVLEMPSVVVEAGRFVGSGDRCERLSYVPGDFFVAVPEGADAHLLCGVLHDWSDERASAILKNCRSAVAENGRLLLVEMVVPEDDANCFSKLLDLNMMVMTGGRERTQADFARLLNASGYRLSRIVPTLAPQSLIEAVPV